MDWSEVGPLIGCLYCTVLCCVGAGKGHKHPVYAMSIVNDAELVSVSTDGMRPDLPFPCYAVT